MEPEQGRERASEASLLSRRQYLLTTGALASGAVTAAAGNAAAATTHGVDVSTATANHTWQSVEITSAYSDPVVIVPSLSYHGTNPSSPRVRNVGSDGFELAVQEWNYLDGAHLSERVSYVLTDTGEFTSESGQQFSVGKAQANHRWRSVSFDASFSDTPVVFSNAQTRNGRHAITTRNRNVSGSGMEIRLQEEEAEGPHLQETVGYLAVEPGSGTLDGRSFEVDGSVEVNSSWQQVSFSGSYEDPVFVADMQGTHGTNTATVRYRNLTPDGVELLIEEERSDDGETAHLPEQCGYLVVEGQTDSNASGYGVGGYGTGGYGQ